MELMMIQQNVCGKKLYDGSWSINDYVQLIKRIRNKKPDIVFFTEFYYWKMYDITQKIFKEYAFITPLSLSGSDKNDQSLYAACVFAIKQTKVNICRQRVLEDMLTLRHICVDIDVGNQIIKMLLMYVPQTYNADRVKTKQKMLRSANTYVKENKNTFLFVGGDLNSDVDLETTSCIEEFKKLYNAMKDTDCKKEATWHDKRLDYALVAGIESDFVQSVPIKTSSDHLGIQTVFYL